MDTGCWPELKHSAGLGFRNAGQDPISTGIQKPHTTYTSEFCSNIYPNFILLKNIYIPEFIKFIY